MDIERQRIINLLQVIHSDKFEGGVGACADACGIQRPNLTAMLNGRKAFGWAVARKIETALDLSPMSLDGLGEAQVKLSQLISTLDAEQQERIRHWVEFEAQTAEARILAKKLHRSPTKGREQLRHPVLPATMAIPVAPASCAVHSLYERRPHLLPQHADRRHRTGASLNPEVAGSAATGSDP